MEITVGTKDLLEEAAISAEEIAAPRSTVQIDTEIGQFHLKGYTLEEAAVRKARQERPKAKAIEADLGKQVLSFLGRHVDVDLHNCEVTRTDDLFNIAKLDDLRFNALVNLQRINDVSGIDELLRATNLKLPVGGRFIGCVETLEASKLRIYKNHRTWTAPWMYISDFVVKRMFPKLKLTRSMYFLLTGGKNRSISKTEALGRCIFCGFRIDEIEEISGLLYFACSKVQEPMEGPAPSKGMLLRIPRIGKAGKKITIYKFRTMHPYAQYLQDFVFENNKLKKGGKFRDDWRITKWGRFMRTFWIDEIPMMWNWLKGDMKLVGVRPLSSHYFGLYTEELQKKRIEQKPGLIPPFYADLPETLAEIMSSEVRYLNSCTDDRMRTDLRYGWLAVNNILSGKAKSS